MTTANDFLAGAVTCGFAVCSLFFLRFWRQARDPFFAAFAGAFLLLGAGQAVLALGGIPTEDREAIYLFRLAAFSLILVAIVRKNKRAR